MYSNFDEIINNMIIPELNSEEFLKLLLTSELECTGKLMLTQNFDYNLNPRGKEDLNFYVDNVRFKAKIFLKSIERLSPEKIQANKNGCTHPDFISFMKFLSTITFEQFWKIMVPIKKINNAEKNIRDIIKDELLDEKVKRELEAEENARIEQLERELKEKQTIQNKEKQRIQALIKYYEHAIILGDIHGYDFQPRSLEWYYFRSYKMSPANTDVFHTTDVKHRLYVTINYDQLMNFTTEFISKLEDIQQPYLLKIKSCLPSGKCPENDTLVIYADSEERVTKYVNILNEMIRNKPEYEQSIHRPSPHLGIIDNKIGYGREFGKDVSYSSVVGVIGSKAMYFALKDIVYTTGFSKSYSKYEMLEIMKQMKFSLSYQDIYNSFKQRFWNKFYEICEQRGYNMDKSICIGDRENYPINKK